MAYDDDAFSQLEECDHDETLINLNRVFSSAQRNNGITIDCPAWAVDLTDPEDCRRISMRIREINSPRKLFGR
jgi:hypothetical protein